MCVYIFIYIYVDVYIYILKIEKSKGNPHQMTCEKVHFGPFHGHSPNYKKVCTKTPKQTHTHSMSLFMAGPSQRSFSLCWSALSGRFSRYILVCPQGRYIGSLSTGLPSRFRSMPRCRCVPVAQASSIKGV